MIVFVKQGNHVSFRRCVDSDANSDEVLNSDVNSAAPLHLMQNRNSDAGSDALDVFCLHCVGI